MKKRNSINGLWHKQLKFQRFLLTFASGKKASLKISDLQERIENNALVFTAELEE